MFNDTSSKRQLATIQKIKELQPIPGADKIELAVFKDIAWQCIVGKGEFTVGSKVIYCEIDSVLPEKPEFEFLRGRCFIDNGIVKGFRIRTLKLRGTLSQGICFPVTVLDGKGKIKTGIDVTKDLGVVLYEKPERHIQQHKPKGFRQRLIYYLRNKLFPRHRFGKFPSFIPKTDETRIQSCPNLLEQVRGKMLQVSEELDGTSATYAIKGKRFYICSRNMTRNVNRCVRFLKKSFHWSESGILEDNRIWNRIAKEYEIEEHLRKFKKNVAIQGEIIGEGIQGNKYNFKGNSFFLFSVYDIDNKCYLNYPEMLEFLKQINSGDCKKIPFVPMINDECILQTETIDNLIFNSKGKSCLNRETLREGLVYRTVNDKQKVAFKVINNDFLLKHNE